MAGEKPIKDLKIESSDPARQPTVRISIRLPIDTANWIDEIRGVKKEGTKEIVPDKAPTRSEVIRNVLISFRVFMLTSFSDLIEAASKDNMLEDLVKKAGLEPKAPITVGRPSKEDETTPAVPGPDTKVPERSRSQ